MMPTHSTMTWLETQLGRKQPYRAALRGLLLCFVVDEFVARMDSAPCPPAGEHPTCRWQRGEEVLRRGVLWIDRQGMAGSVPSG
jgi:hypothetical protein